MRIDLVEFKSTATRTCREQPDMRTYRAFLGRFASREHGTARVRHVRSLVSPRYFDCTYPPVHH